MNNAPELLPCPFCGGRAIANLNGGLCYIYCETCEVWQPPFHVLDDAAAAWNRRADISEAAIAAAPAEGERIGVERAVRVKPLVWSRNNIGLCNMIASHSAEVVYGRWFYSIAEFRDGSAKLTIEGTEIGRFPTIDAAKAAAQADYEARIRAAMDAKP